MKKSNKDVNILLEETDLKETAKSLAEQYSKLFGCPCEVTMHEIHSEGESDLGERIRIDHSVRLLD